MPRQEELRLLQAYAAGDSAAGNLVVQSHLRYVMDLAKRYVGHGVPFEELIQEGNLGLMRALKKFSVARTSSRDGQAYRFIAFASYWVKAMMSRAIQEKGKTVKIDRRTALRLAKVRKLDRHLESDLGREATEAEIAAHLGVNEAVARRIRVAEAYRCRSFEQPLAFDDGGETTLHAVLAADQPTAEDASERQSSSDRLDNMLALAEAVFSDRDRKILHERLLRDKEERKTHDQLSKELGVSRARVYQLETRIVRNLREMYGQTGTHKEGR